MTEHAADGVRVDLRSPYIWFGPRQNDAHGLKYGQPSANSAVLNTTSLERSKVMSDSYSSPSVVYRPIPRFPGYRAGSDGTIWSCCRTGGNGNPIGQVGESWNLRKPCLGTNGYLRIILRKDGRRVERMVHHLILEAFIGPRPQGMECRHYPDPTKTNNTLSNLQWGTSVENKWDRFPGRATATHKQCSSCGLDKLLSLFTRKASSLDGRSCWCRQCHREHMRKRRAARHE